MQLRYQSRSRTDIAKRRSGIMLVSTWLALLGVSLGFVELLRQAALPWSYKLLHLIMAATIALNVICHLKAAACRSPGFTCEVTSWTAVEKHQLTWRWCKQCQLPKPPRAHHCKTCGRCVLKIDHHCPWLDNCIGLHNYRSFVLLLLHTMLGCAYTTPWFWQAACARSSKASLLVLARSLHVSPLAPLLCLCVTLAAGAGCGVLLCWHLYLIATGQTTLEFYAARKSAKAATAEGHKLVRIHDLGLKENFKEAFQVGGRWGWLACILPGSPPLPPAGMGVALPAAVDWSSWEAPPVKRARTRVEVDCEAGGFFSPRSSPCRSHAARYLDGLAAAQQPPALVV